MPSLSFSYSHSSSLSSCALEPASEYSSCRRASQPASSHFYDLQARKLAKIISFAALFQLNQILAISSSPPSSIYLLSDFYLYFKPATSMYSLRFLGEYLSSSRKKNPTQLGFAQQFDRKLIHCSVRFKFSECSIMHQQSLTWLLEIVFLRVERTKRLPRIKGQQYQRG